jgi:hypothetical protein
MEISQTLLGLMYVWAVVAGALWGVVYDVLRLIRTVLGFHTGERVWHKVVLFAEDVLFGLVGGVILILLLYYTNNGQFRGLAPLGMVSGFFVYEQTVGRLVRLCLDWLVAMIGRMVRWAVRCVCLPFRMLYRLYERVIGRRLRERRDRIRLRRMEEETRRVGERHIKEAAVGFGLYVPSEEVYETHVMKEKS